VAATWRFLRSGAVAVAAVEDADMAELDALMARYHDRPMDFADATLVRLAQRESLTTILTIDHDDFETYRIGRRRSFRVLPERQSLRR
jgi:predicted nucleic acid-binding protein